LEEVMNITVIGRGNVGGGLAGFWRAAGHEVQELGRDGGDASEADAVVVAVPADTIADALGRVTGLQGKVAIDTTNAVRGRPEGFESLAHQVKSLTGGPTAKAFNTIFARTYDEVGAQRVRPSCLYCGDDDARDITRALVADAGFDPIAVGDLSHAAGLEDFLLNVIFPVAQSGQGPFFYRIAGAGEL
jgi:8-hydroxy-5-deazaflavin:NADPH oxidoreductase